jgi:hypothetical protein
LCIDGTIYGINPILDFFGIALTIAFFSLPIGALCEITDSRMIYVMSRFSELRLVSIAEAKNYPNKYYFAAAWMMYIV